jgi:hypothetical protein
MFNLPMEWGILVHGIGILSNKKIGQRLARFRQVNMDNPMTHHDALEFPDGQVILVRACAMASAPQCCNYPPARGPPPRRGRSSSRSFASPYFDLIAQTETTLIDECDAKSRRHSRWVAGAAGLIFFEEDKDEENTCAPS